MARTENESLVDYALTEIREKIQNGTYPPGTKLSTQEISDSLGISRTPVVSALNRLVAEGLAEAIPRRGTIVTRLSSKRIRDLIEVRTMIEVFSVKFAVQNLDFYPELVAEMEELLEKFDNIDEYDYDSAGDLEMRFHSLIVAMTGNDDLTKIFKSNWGIGATFYMYSTSHMPLSMRKRSFQEHEQLLLLLKQRDVAALETALEDHIRDAFKVLSWIMDKYPGNFT